MLIQKPVPIAELYKQVKELPARVASIRDRVVSSNQRHVSLTINFLNQIQPLLHQQVKHEELCDAFAPGYHIAAQAEALLAKMNQQQIMPLFNIAAAYREMEDIAHAAEQFLKDVSHETDFFYDFTSEAENLASPDLLKELPLINTRNFILNFMNDQKKVIEGVSAKIQPADPALVKNRALRDALAPYPLRTDFIIRHA